MPRARIAAYVRRHANEIGREWTEGTRARVSAYRRMPEATLLRNMQWNAKVVAHLIGTGHYPRGSRYIAWLAATRLRYQFAIGDVIRAILLCRDLLCARLGTPEGCELTSRAMERLLVDFAARFHTLQLREQMQRSAELVRMQEQIKRHELERQVEQAEKLASLGQLAAGLAHEIGTPLTVISGNAEYVLMHLGDDHPRRAELREIIRETDRIAGLIRRLLDYARPKPLTVASLDLNALAREAAGVLARQAENAGVHVRLDLNESLPPVPGDGGQLEQVLVNLGLNAIQAMPHGGTLTIGTRRTLRRSRSGPSRPMASVTVADTGVGIPAKDRGEIFKPFFSTKPAREGTGLGLAVCQRIVGDHGGDIRVRTRVGHGTTFTLRLPSGGARARG
jgi:signal transduction histidine kinase